MDGISNLSSGKGLDGLSQVVANGCHSSFCHEMELGESAGNILSTQILTDLTLHGVLRKSLLLKQM